MSEQEAIAYAEKLRREREADCSSPEQARSLLKAAGILNDDGEVNDYYKEVIA